MKKQNNFIITFAVLAIFAVNISIYSQSKTGTTIGQFLKIEPSSRAVAIGNAGSALQGEASFMYYNPASLGSIAGVDVQFTHNQWLADIEYNYAVAAINFSELGTFSIMVTSLNSGEINVRTVEQPLGTGEKYSVTNFALGLGYGRKLTDRVAVGIQLTYINESIWHSSLNAFALNFGVQYQISESGAYIGASVSNFGSRSSYSGRDLYIDYDFDPHKYGDNDQLPSELRTDEYPLPTMFRAGISYPFNFGDSYHLLLSVDAVHPNDNDESINIGAELELFGNLILRGGYRNLFLSNSEGGLALGGGIKTNIGNDFNIRFDYAWGDYGILTQTHRITVGLGIN